MAVGTERIVYSPVGECIYCGSTEDELTDEHVLPYGLGGNHVLPKSSCKACARETGRVEQHCLKEIFWSARIRENTQSRSGIPSKLKAKLGNEQGETFVEVPIDKFPDHLLLMNFKPPGILSGVAPSVGISGKMLGWEFGEKGLFHERVTELGARYFYPKPFNPGMLMRMLAKIGHAHAIADPNLPKFSSLLPELILGRYETPAYLVGCLGEIPDAEHDIVHRINSQICEIDIDGKLSERYLVVRIRLFATYGTPEYHVVVARLPVV